MKLKKYDLLLLIIYIILFFSTIIDDCFGKWLLLCILVMCTRFIYLHRYNQPILIIIIFIMTYFLYMVIYYFFEISYSTFSNLQTLTYTNGTLRVISLFVTVLLYGIKKKLKGDPPIRNNIHRLHSSVACMLCMAVMLAICIFAGMGENIFDANYGDETTNSSIFEYYFMFAILAKINIKNEIEDKIFIIINILYLLFILMLGLRLVGLMIIMMLFVFYMEDRYNNILVVLFLLGGFVIMSMLSIIRLGIYDVDWMMLLGVHDNVLMNNQGDVFLTSTVHYGITQNGFMDYYQRIESMFAFVANIFLPSTYQLPSGILNEYIRKYYAVGGGGFGAMYAYVWLGYIGVIGLATFIVYFINALIKAQKGSLYGCFLVITSFRWFAYSLPIVFKMGLYFIILYYIIKKFLLFKRENSLRTR